MIVCSCNVLSDRDVRSAVEAERTRSTSQVYGCLGCSAQCGRCARTIRRIMDEALTSAQGCQQACPVACKTLHVHVAAEISVALETEAR
jgi:bacterioferritin-associated ferredoxin